MDLDSSSIDVVNGDNSGMAIFCQEGIFCYKREDRGVNKEFRKVVSVQLGESILSL